MACGHLQAAGLDDRGRKQYCFHPRWRQMRDGNAEYANDNDTFGLTTLRTDRPSGMAQQAGVDIDAPSAARREGHPWLVASRSWT